MGLEQTNFSTIKEYLEQESNSQVKHEFEKGSILAMTGGSLNHGILCGNAYNELSSNLEDSDSSCNAYGSEIRIHIEAVDSIVYPDAMVICEEINTSDKDKDAVINPIVIVEVLSKSTESYDRGDKFYKYRQLDSFREYILISQDKPMVETFYKKEDNVWEIARYIGLDAQIVVKSLGVTINSQELYLNVKFNDQY
ncbi:MAG: Uma2 family endonuclease [Bacteroidota bacterium]